MSASAGKRGQPAAGAGSGIPGGCNVPGAFPRRVQACQKVQVRTTPGLVPPWVNVACGVRLRKHAILGLQACARLPMLLKIMQVLAC